MLNFHSFRVVGHGSEKQFKWVKIQTRKLSGKGFKSCISGLEINFLEHWPSGPPTPKM